MSEAVVTDPIDVRIMLIEAYETVYGICDHDSEGLDDPLALVSMHPKEDTATYGRLYGELMRFSKEESFRDMWGLSIMELLELPKDVVDEMYRITREAQEEHGQNVSSVSRKMMREARKVGQ